MIYKSKILGNENLYKWRSLWGTATTIGDVDDYALGKDIAI